jgi:hypothetical protein
METLGQTNICTTDCGHTFCLKCMLRSFQNNNSCPCCRAELVEESETNDSDEDDEDYESDDDDETIEDDEDEDETDIEKEASVEKIAEQFTAKGYTLVDALSMLLGRYTHIPGRDNNEYYDKLSEDFDEIIDDLDREMEAQYYEREMMGDEDHLYTNISRNVLEKIIDTVDTN